MNKKVRATVYVGILLWVVAFVQMGITRVLYRDDNLSYAFARNQLIEQETVTELKVNLGKKTINRPAWEEKFGKELEYKQSTVGGTHYIHATMQGNQREELKLFLEGSGYGEYEIYTQTLCYCRGKISDEKRKRLVKGILRQCGAYQVKEVEGDGWYTAYGYTIAETEFVNLNGARVNIDISITYDENSARSQIYVGTPLLSKGY